MGRTKTVLIIWCGFLLSSAVVTARDEEIGYNIEKDTMTIENTRDRRDVIEEERYHNIRSEMKKENKRPTHWIPGQSLDDSAAKISITTEKEEELPPNPTTERVTDKPTGRGARASNENWVKLPFPEREESERNNVLTPPQPSGELLNSRMPRINFVTQSKGIESAESKDNIQRSSRNGDRQDFVRPGEEEKKQQKPVYPRQALYYPEESRKFYDDRYYPADDIYRRELPYDMYDRRRTYYPGPRMNRYDENYDSYSARKPKRIIYYAHLPEVVRTPPNVDLRYRYPADPYRRFEDDQYSRSGRYDHRFRSGYPYPYAPLRKDDRAYRDLAGAGTDTKLKKTEEKVTVTPIMNKDDKYKGNLNKNRNRNLVDNHHYQDTVDIHYTEPLFHKSFEDVVRSDDGYLRYDEPLFQSAVEDAYRQKF